MITENIALWALEPYLAEYSKFFAMIVGAFVLGLTPLRYPFQWMETYYHELSHGLAALLTFGKVGRIKLNRDGSGWCSTRGGSRFIILLAGYMGAALWGGYLYLAGWYAGEMQAVKFLQLEIIFIVIATLLWVRDIMTLGIMITMGVTFYLPTLVPEWSIVPLIIQFIGIYVVLNAIRAPLHLIDGQHVGDGAALADLTFIFPEGVWIAFWFLFSWLVLGVLMYLTLPGFNTLIHSIQASLMRL